tara:strand:+ start:15773 stop:16174 length:402 start_codon:yes stop_codon:yes gene_type:complete
MLMNGSQMLEEQEQAVYNELARRFLEEKKRFKEAEASVERLKEEMKEALNGRDAIVTKDYSITYSETNTRRMMKKIDFIEKHSPPKVNADGQVILGANGKPVLDTDVGTKVYEEHLIDCPSRRFYVKKNKDKK